MIIKGKYTEAEIKAVEYDDGVVKQIYNMLQSPGINNKVVVMPDTHVGKGSVVGFTMPVTNRVIPNVVGVDIGCGMLTAKINAPKQTLQEIDTLIREVIPVGFNVHKFAVDDSEGLTDLVEKLGSVSLNYVSRSIGTLGGGNHFIELGKHNNEWYITIHTGSRNLGLKTCQYHQKKAQEECRNRQFDYKKELQKLKRLFVGKELGNKINELKLRSAKTRTEKELAYLQGDSVQEYLNDMYICQEYASKNRLVILEYICGKLCVGFSVIAESVHNYISPQDKIIRKGAISAYKNETVIIPINRTFGTIIGTGKGNAEWNYSAPHGAGRLMSRGEAKRNFTQEDANNLIGDVYSTNNPIDECDLVYKSPQSIIDAISPTVNIDFVIKPVLNIKG